MRFPLMLISADKVENWSGPYRSLGARLAAIRPTLGNELGALEVEVDAFDFAFSCMLNALLYSLVIFGVSYLALSVRGEIDALLLALAYGIVVLVLSFLVNLFYPSIIVNMTAEAVDRDLPFALREMALQIEGGIPLYDTMADIASSNFGAVSREFAVTVAEVNSGYSEKVALERMAVRTRSEFLKKSLWQVVTALTSGAALAPVLRQIADMMKARQVQQLKDYSSSLNFMVWIYLLTSVVLPALIVTFLVIYATFSADLNPAPLINAILIISCFVQVAIIGFIGQTKPKVNK